MSVRPLLPPKVAAAVLSVSLSTLKRMTAAGHIAKPVKISDRRVGYRPADIDRFLTASRDDA